MMLEKKKEEETARKKSKRVEEERERTRKQIQLSRNQNPNTNQWSVPPPPIQGGQSEAGTAAFLGHIRREVLNILQALASAPPRQAQTQVLAPSLNPCTPNPELGGGREEAPVIGSNGVLYWNIRGLLLLSNKTKIMYLKTLAIMRNPLTIVLTETHLNPNILDAEVNIPGNTLHRSDRVGRTHGGTCAYVRTDLATQLLLVHSNAVCESLVLKIKTLDLVLVSIYRPPDSSVEVFGEALKLCQEALNDAFEKDPKVNDILQFGDYNFSFIMWPSKTIYQDGQEDREKKSSNKEQGEILINYMEENFIENYFLVPTRGKNILDLCLSNNPTLIGKVVSTISKNISDHNLMDIELNHQYNQPKETKTKEKPYTTNLHQYDIMNADEEDWLRWRSLVEEVNFDKDTEEMNVEEKMKTFYSILEDVAAKVFKKKEYSDEPDDDVKKSKNKIPKEVRLLMRQIKDISNRIKVSNN